MPGQRGLTFEKRLWAKIDKTGGEDACWRWMAATNPQGYGLIGRGSREAGLALAHRATYELLVGPIPVDMFVCHRCDNPACCNPAHVFIGTNTDNMRDAERKGRVRNGTMKGSLDFVPRGENHWTRKPGARPATGAATKPKLASFVAEIRASSEPSAVLAARYGTSGNSIRAIRRYRAYA